jgi:hypothetical protein
MDVRDEELRKGNVATLNDDDDDEEWIGEEAVADFARTLDKFSAIGSFDADSPSASPPTCVQIEDFRESCDIPPRRRGKDRENVKNDEQAERGETERPGTIRKLRKGP